MDFSSQPKLSKAEWISVEEPVPEDEQNILKMIIAGYNDINIKHNINQSLLTITKIEPSDLIENYLYHKFFAKRIQELRKFVVKEQSIKSMKKADLIRLDNISEKLGNNLISPIEYVFIDFAKEMLQLHQRNAPRYAYYLYTLIQLRHINVPHINKHVLAFIDQTVEEIRGKTHLSQIVSQSYEFIEKNPHIYKYGDISLYDHQKRLFSTMKRCRHIDRRGNTEFMNSNLVLYIAPTGTGKTLSPIGLSNEFRIIYVCAARHVGIALAKSAISVHKCVAFAFGCETAADIRLHYYSALSYKVDKRSGGIGKVDNSVGNKVEIMICDVKSYICAMHYMLSFNQATNIITYWDEPTIGMDDTNESNVLHEITHRNWSENKIPHMVLSSATLPKQAELESVIADFRMKFDNVVVTEINSYDCNKSISLLNKMGYVVCPHLLHEKYDDMIRCVNYCSENKTLLRYFDLQEVVRFIDHMTKTDCVGEDFSPHAYFDGCIEKIKMNSIKLYYMDLLLQVDEAKWPFIFKAMKDSLRLNLPGERAAADLKKSVSLDTATNNQNAQGGAIKRTTSVFVPRVQPKTPLQLAQEKSAAAGRILLTTVDAHTLTDGPTIYLAEDVDKIAQFYIQQSHIPKDVFDAILEKIARNNAVIASVEKLEAELQDFLGKEAEKEKKMSATQLTSPKAKQIEDSIADLKTQIQCVSLDPMYIPNTVGHQDIWTNKLVENAYVPYIDPDSVRSIMGLEIPDGLKVLLLLGIGVFCDAHNSSYVEIIKKLAYNKQLFMIVASSDYIYGTNYQFCHGFLGKDLLNMTQQKTIQALGRIGRNNIQQEYSARFRDDALIANLFKAQEYNLEAVNMCRLLVTDE